MFGTSARDARRGMLVLGGAVLAALGIFWILDAVRYPWAVSLTSPTLPGIWSENVNTAASSRQWLAIELRADDAGRHGNQKVLGARALLCSANGAREYDGYSRPHDWRGTRFDITLVATDPRPEGWALIRLSAEWNGEDVIRARAQLEAGGSQTIAVERSGAITRPDSSRATLLPVSHTLHRMTAGTEALRCFE